MLSISFAPSASALAAPTVAAADTHMAAALDLARLINKASQMEDQVDRMLASIATQGFATDPDLIALKEEYPGAEKVFVDTMRPIMISELEQLLPEYNQAIADFFASRFTPVEIAELTVFWRSEAGQELLRSVSSKLDFAAMTKDVVGQVGNDGDVMISREAVDADKRKAAVSGIRTLSPQHRTAIMRFSLTPAGRKMAKFVGEKNEIDREWTNRPLSPEAEARVDSAVTEALLAFMEEEDRKRAAAQ